MIEQNAHLINGTNQTLRLTVNNLEGAPTAD